MRQAVVASSLDLLKGFLPKGRIFREQPGNVGLVYKWARVLAPRRTEGAPRLKTERSLAPRLLGNLGEHQVAVKLRRAHLAAQQRIHHVHCGSAQMRGWNFLGVFVVIKMGRRAVTHPVD